MEPVKQFSDDKLGEPKAKSKRKHSYALVANPDTTLVGANLPPRYAKIVALLHASTGLSKKELLIEALDDLWIKRGGSLAELLRLRPY